LENETVIYLRTGNNQHVVILEPGNLEAIKGGAKASTPNHAVFVAYTPDAVWLGEQITANFDDLTPAVLDRLIKESQARSEVHERPYHPRLDLDSRKKVADA
jgi:hypothetical protein